MICADREGKEHQIEADSVVLATGLQSREDVYARFEGLAPRVFKVGDCVKPGKIYDAFRDAWHAVFSI